ncbi:MAG: tagaturonate reductase [Cyclobacteriaceae bacterium]
MQSLNRTTASLNTKLPIRIIQFGEGNFLRAFADWMIDQMNIKAGFRSGVVVVQPIAQGMVNVLDQQQGLYHHLQRGLIEGEPVDEVRLISCIQQSINPFEDLDAYLKLAENPELKIVISNTTEAGIEFIPDDKPEAGTLAKSFPGKLTQLLKYRYDHFGGAAERGLVVIPCELINLNGTHLKEAILNYAKLWQYSPDFTSWLENSNFFADTLVDRIVPGYPKEEIAEIKERIGFDDQLVVSSEAFHLWVIQGPKEIQEAFPADQYGFNVKFANDLSPYRTRKVRILNGAHTSLVSVGLLTGLETVKEGIEDEVAGNFIKQVVFEEIAPTIDLEESELHKFANEVIERFMNPYIRHELIAISLNSISKFKVRVLPSLLDYFEDKGSLPQNLVFALAGLIKLYLSQDRFTLKDNPEFLEFFTQMSEHTVEEIVQETLQNQAFWAQDLTLIGGLKEEVVANLQSIESKGMKDAIKSLDR